MNVHSSQTPLQACEDILREEIRYNAERNIAFSETQVANLLLSRGVEMRAAYEELHAKLNAHPPALKVFIGLVLSTAAHWSPEKNAEARAERDRLVEFNARIAACAEELADLLERRSASSCSFITDTHSSVYEVIEVAAERNYLFKSYVRPHFERLGHFDGRYWPSLADFVRQLGWNAAQADPQAADALTAAGTESSRPSTADFVRALLKAIEENSARMYGQLPSSFEATNNTLAVITNCALDLEPHELKDGAYIKNIRFRANSK